MRFNCRRPFAADKCAGARFRLTIPNSTVGARSGHDPYVVTDNLQLDRLDGRQGIADLVAQDPDQALPSLPRFL